MPDLPFLQRQVVRDLAWAIFGPGLITDYSCFATGAGVHNLEVPFTDRHRSWLQTLDRNPDSLHAHLARLKSTRLGIYFEALWQFFLQQDMGLELVAANVPLRVAGRTLGEFDLLLRDRATGTCMHLELAIKYYLDTPGSNMPGGTGAGDLERWLGPNSRDRLDLKLDHLLRHQTRLSTLPQAAKLLRARGISPPEAGLDRRVVLKGQLFYRHATGDATECTDPSLNSEHQRGWWLPHTEKAALAQRAPAWRILERNRWISPAQLDLQRDEAAGLISAAGLIDRLEQHFNRHNTPLMVCAMVERDGFALERERYMVTRADWPRG